MRLVEVTVRNYRVHRECRARFEGNLILVRGPNESGKSTFVEAIHRALFLRAKGTGEAHSEMKSDSGGDPEVEVVFEAGGCEYRLRKVFSGNSGKATLAANGMSTLTGDAAEEKLAELLGFKEPLSGRGAIGALPRRWAHLWVRQGTSAESPILAAEESHSDLNRNLRALSGSGLLISELDARLISKLRMTVEATYTTNGQFRKHAPVRDALDALDAKRLQLENREEALRQLESAARDLGESSVEMVSLQSHLSSTGEQLERVSSSLSEVDEARKRLSDAEQGFKAAASGYSEVQDADQKIRELERELKTATEAAAPAREEVDRLTKEVTRSREQLRACIRRREQSSQNAGRQRSLEVIWEAHCGSLETAERLGELRRSQARINKVQEEIREIRNRLATLSGFTPAVVKKLTRLQREAEAARARFEAYALRFDLIASDLEVKIGDRPLQAGDGITLSESVEVSVGNGTRIRLTPGGAKDLEDAREASERSERAFAEALRECGAASMEEAERSAGERSQAETQFETLRERLESLKPSEVEERFPEVEEQLAQLTAQRDQRTDSDNPILFPDSLIDARERLREVTRTSESAQAAEQSAIAEEREARSAEETAARKLQDATEEADGRINREKELAMRLELERERWGDSGIRSEKLLAARREVELAEAAVLAEKQKLEKLGPDQLDLDRKRFEQTIENLQRSIQAARDRQIRARTLLQQSGSTDPEREVKESRAECERLERRCSDLTAEAEAQRFLLELLEETRNEASASLSGPLEEIVAHYLQDLFGAGTSSRLEWSAEGDALEGVRVDRSAGRAGVYEFDQLSHGTREQVGLALRLAMTEVLASDFDGCLPVVLDDAFTHADRDRIQLLQRLLYRASQRGLQIIILTCHPENYAGLTTSEIRLERSMPTE